MDYTKAIKELREKSLLSQDELDKLEGEGKVFVISPSEPINIKMLEGDLHKLKDLYVL